VKTSFSVSQADVSLSHGSVTVWLTVETRLTNKTAVSDICVHLFIVFVHKDWTGI